MALTGSTEEINIELNQMNRRLSPNYKVLRQQCELSQDDQEYLRAKECILFYKEIIWDTSLICGCMCIVQNIALVKCNHVCPHPQCL